MVMIPEGAQAKLGDMPTNEPVPEATYHLRVDKAELKKTGPNSKTPDAPMVEAQFTIFGPSEAEEFHGRKLFENLMLVGAGRFRLRQLLEASGEAEDFVLEDTEQLLNREVAAVVQVDKARRDPNTGQDYPARNRIARFMTIE